MLKFVKLKKKHLQLVLDWRTSPEITRYMNTDIEYDMDKQIHWFEQISNNKNCRYWFISYREEPVGLISINNIDWQNKHCNGGYYISKQWHRNRFGAVVHICMLNHIFNSIKLQKHFAEILSENKNSLKMHRSIGYKEIETIKDYVNKNGHWNDMIILEFRSTDWSKLQDKYSKYMVTFE